MPISNVVILIKEPSSVVEELAKALNLHLQKSIDGCETHLETLSAAAAASPSANIHYVSTLGMDPGFRSRLTDEDSTALRKLTSNGRYFLWLADQQAEQDVANQKGDDDGLTEGMRIMDLGATENLMPALLDTCEDVAEALMTEDKGDTRKDTSHIGNVMYGARKLSVGQIQPLTAEAGIPTGKINVPKIGVPAGEVSVPA